MELNLIPSKEMVFSDHLRSNVDTNAKKPNKPIREGLVLKIQDVYLNVSNDKCLSLATETDKDETLVSLKS